MKNVIVRNIGCRKYSEVWQIQQEIFHTLLSSKCAGKEDNAKNKNAQQVLILCEHPHVYTLGKSGNVSNLLVDTTFLEKIEAEFYRIDRGGDVTYHGYGQLVGYPLLDLQRLEISLRDYIQALEETIIRTVAEYGIIASRQTGATGVWIDPDTPQARKIAAIGVRASRYVTMHGFALNVTTDLDYFAHINPCGFSDRGVTSIRKETGISPSLEEVVERYTTHFKDVFKCNIK